jgi:hypothetical protein
MYTHDVFVLAGFAGYKKERWNIKHVSSMPEE